MDIKIFKDKGKVMFLDQQSGVGIQFEEGARLQRYLYALVFDDLEKLEKAESSESIQRRLVEYAAKLYPMEFATINPSNTDGDEK